MKHHANGKPRFIDCTSEASEAVLLQRISTIEAELERLNEVVTGLLLGRK